MKTLKTARTVLLAALLTLSALSGFAARDADHRAPVAADRDAAPVDGSAAACAAPRAC